MGEPLDQDAKIDYYKFHTKVEKPLPPLVEGDLCPPEIIAQLE